MNEQRSSGRIRFIDKKGEAIYPEPVEWDTFGRPTLYRVPLPLPPDDKDVPVNTGPLAGNPADWIDCSFRIPRAGWFVRRRRCQWIAAHYRAHVRSLSTVDVSAEYELLRVLDDEWGAFVSKPAQERRVHMAGRLCLPVSLCYLPPAALSHLLELLLQHIALETAQKRFRVGDRVQVKFEESYKVEYNRTVQRVDKHQGVLVIGVTEAPRWVHPVFVFQDE